MSNSALTDFLKSNYIQKSIKSATKCNYNNYSDETLEEIAKQAQHEANQLDDKQLIDYLDKNKDLTKRIRQLPYDHFSWMAYSINQLVTTLWVSDLPHRVTHGNLRDVLQFARNSINRSESPIFFERVKRLRKLEAICSLPILVVEPSCSQRSCRKIHSPCAEKPFPPPQCKIEYLVEGNAYIEDGNHRVIANLLNTKEEELRVIQYAFS